MSFSNLFQEINQSINEINFIIATVFSGCQYLVLCLKDLLKMKETLSSEEFLGFKTKILPVI